MLHITSSWLTYLRIGCLYFLIPFTYLTQHLSPFPLATICLFSVSTSLFLLCLFLCFVFLTKHISKIIKYLSFSLWLILLSIRNSRSIHIVINGNISFYLISECLCLHIYICIHTYICVCVYIHTSMYTYIHVCVYTCIHTCMYMYIYIHTRCTYTYIHLLIVFIHFSIKESRSLPYLGYCNIAAINTEMHICF